jgi:L-ascorbate metabolism protein UlaG (beta-lactamase superfamily)
MKIQWLGHAGVKITGAGSVVYIDPSEMPYLGRKAREVMSRQEAGDVILVSHEHADHCSPEVIARLRKPSTAIVGPSSCRAKVGAGLHEVKPGDTLSFGNVSIRVVEAYNVARHRSPGTPFHPKGTGVGYIVTIDGKTVYHAGDTEPIQEMESIGPVDVALLPVDDHYTMSPAEALRGAALVRAGTMIPMHFFETGAESVLRAAKDAPDVHVAMLGLGEAFELD